MSGATANWVLAIYYCIYIVFTDIIYILHSGTYLPVSYWSKLISFNIYSFRISSSYNLYSNNCKTHFFHLPTLLTYKTIYNITVWHFPLDFSRSLEMGKSDGKDSKYGADRIRVRLSIACNAVIEKPGPILSFGPPRSEKKESKWKTEFFKRNSIELRQQSTEAKSIVEFNSSRSPVDTSNGY